MAKGPDPVHDVSITRVAHRGDYYTITGTVRGRGEHRVDIPAVTLKQFTRDGDAVAMMRRSLYGVAHLPKHDHDT